MLSIASTYTTYARPLRMGLCAAMLLNVGSLAAVQRMNNCGLLQVDTVHTVESCQAPQAKHQMFSAAAAASIGFGLAFAGLLPGSYRRKESVTND